MLSCELLAILIALIIAISKGMVKTSSTSPSKSVRDNVALTLRKVDGVEDIRVTKAGNDSPGNGSRDHPYLTITYAISVASEFARIFADSGNYDEEVDVNVGSVRLIMHDDTIIDTTTNGGTSLTVSAKNVIVKGGEVDYSGAGATTNLVNLTGDFTKLINVHLQNTSGQTVTNMIKIGYYRNHEINLCSVSGNNATYGIDSDGTGGLFLHNYIANSTNGIRFSDDSNKTIMNTYETTTGLTYQVGSDNNLSYGDIFNCTTDVSNAGVGNIVVKAEYLEGIKDIPRWGTPVNAGTAQPPDNAGTVSYPINLTVTKESQIFMTIEVLVSPGTDTMTIETQYKADGTNWQPISTIASSGGTTTLDGRVVYYVTPGTTTRAVIVLPPLFINSSTGYRVALSQAAGNGGDPAGTIGYTYNTLEKL